MANIIKEKLQEVLHQKALKAYEEELDRQKNSWRRQLKGGILVGGKAWKAHGKPGFFVIPYAQAGMDAIAEAEKADCAYVIFAAEDGCFAPGDLEALAAELSGASQVLAYADEDVYLPDPAGDAAEGVCCAPYFKPDGSPDTLLSYFYIGGMAVMRTAAAARFAAQMPEPYRTAGAFPFVYFLTLLLMAQEMPLHIRKILFHRRAKQPPGMQKNMVLAEPFGGGKEFTALKSAFLQQVFPEQKIPEQKIEWKEEADGLCYPLYPLPQAMVSILIPSKDHPEVLKRAVASIREKSSFAAYEILVIDNGSTEEAKAVYEALAEEYGFRYLYRPMPFHFSKMCNLAAATAKGEYLLFLNDDTEVITPDWLERMLGQAALPEAGAVGAKLYYPDGDLIQHCGVTNMYEGPVHKLFGYTDSVSYDRGRNRGVVDMVGVTAACLMVSRGKFERVGGFPEELAVAYNDVDFCFSLYEAGYRNIMRNDVRLYHYESLSRGDDHQDAAKQQRLFRERMTLFTRHPDFADFDPYYNTQLTGASKDYEPGMPHENRDLPAIRELKPLKKVPVFAPVNEALIVKSDRLNVKPYAKELNAVLIDIHAHVRGLDSADYKFSVFLRKGELVYQVPVFRRYRPDVERVYFEQTHVELSGLAARIAGGVLPNGEYELWVEADSLISRQRLFRRAEQMLKVD